jgi:Na+/proline symporter
VATYASGSSLFICLENTYTNGLYYIIARLGLSIAILFAGLLALRMEEFMKNISVAEAMRDLYGRKAQLITAVSGILKGIGFTAMQFNVMIKILEIAFQIESGWSIWVAAGIMIVYSTFGGIRAVTFTDVFQFLTFATVIPVLCAIIWSKLEGGNSQVAATLTNTAVFNPKEVIGYTPRFMSTVGLFLYFALPDFKAAMFQRIVMSKDVKQARDAFAYSSAILLLIFIFIAWVGILLLAENPELTKEEVVPYLMNKHVYVGLKGLLGICVMALAMSTADSSLNASAVQFSNDILALPNDSEQAREVAIGAARLCSIVLGFLALLLALYSTDILKLLLLSSSFYMPIITVPMLMAVLGFRSTSRAALVGMAAGVTTVVVWSILWKNGDSIVPGMLANLIGLVGTHYLLGEKGGWVKKATLVTQPTTT